MATTVVSLVLKSWGCTAQWLAAATSDGFPALLKNPAGKSLFSGQHFLTCRIKMCCCSVPVGTQALPSHTPTGCFSTTTLSDFKLRFVHPGSLQWFPLSCLWGVLIAVQYFRGWDQFGFNLITSRWSSARWWAEHAEFTTYVCGNIGISV